MNDNGGQKDNKRRCQFIKFNLSETQTKSGERGKKKLNPRDAINVINQN
jgi:hypothetical protein